MTTKPLTFICAQPIAPYYAWQLEVMLKNFADLKLHEKYNIHILCAFNTNEAQWEVKMKNFQLVEERYENVAQFFYYQDTRTYPLIPYYSSIRPNILKQHLKVNKDNISKAIFYHDCDIVFTKYPDFLDNIIHDDIWYLSDTRSYIGHDYILSKGQDVLETMCNIMSIEPNVIKEKQNDSGGAQYIIKNVDEIFFHKMEKDCERLYTALEKLNAEKKQQNPNYHELQIFCIDMWAILWGAWLRGQNTKIIPELNFAWATDHIQKWQECYIYHNAGVIPSIANTHFYKGEFINKTPFNHEAIYDPNKCSYNYFQHIKSIGENSCLC